jgi:hypothetical protein
LHGGVLFFNSAHVRHARPAVQKRCQFVQLLRRTDGVDLDAAIILIPDPAPQAEVIGIFFHKPPETDTLHAAGNEPAPRLDFPAFQCADSFSPSGSPSSMRSWIVERNTFAVNGLGIKLNPISTTYRCTTCRSS